MEPKSTPSFRHHAEAESTRLPSARATTVEVAPSEKWRALIDFCHKAHDTIAELALSWRVPSTLLGRLPVQASDVRGPSRSQVSTQEHLALPSSAPSERSEGFIDFMGEAKKLERYRDESSTSAEYGHHTSERPEDCAAHLAQLLTVEH